MLYSDGPSSLAPFLWTWLLASKQVVRSGKPHLCSGVDHVSSVCVSQSQQQRLIVMVACRTSHLSSDCGVREATVAIKGLHLQK